MSSSRYLKSEECSNIWKEVYFLDQAHSLAATHAVMLKNILILSQYLKENGTTWKVSEHQNSSIFSWRPSPEERFPMVNFEGVQRRGLT